MTKTKNDWKHSLTGDVEYISLPNDWIYMRFRKPADKSFVWAERPWHVQGELLVLIPWRPRFDPYKEKIVRADLWFCIPNFPLELFNIQSARAFVRLNNLGDFIRLEHFTIIKNKLKFTRSMLMLILPSHFPPLPQFLVMEPQIGF